MHIMVIRQCLRRLQIDKILAILVILLIFLQIVHFYSLSDLETRAVLVKNADRITSHEDSTIADVIRQVKESHVIDGSGSYFVIRNLITPENPPVSSIKFKQQGDITLVTHCTANHLSDLVDLTRQWNGTISVSVFTYDQDLPFAIRSIVYFHKCISKIRKNVYMHLVFPIDRKLGISDIEQISVDSINCDQSFDDIKSKTRNFDNYAVSGIEYPHNLLRNLAIRATVTGYVFVVDIDMIPSSNLHEDFSKFIQTQKQLPSSNVQVTDKVAFVVPSFEANKSVEIPGTKAELLAEIKQNNIRPFYVEACQRCQKQTKYSDWKDLVDIGILDIGYTVQWKDPWEPFFITDRDLPLYDERFKQYGFNRISQVNNA